MRTTQITLDKVERIKTESTYGEKTGRFDVDPFNGFYELKHPSILHLEEEEIPTPAAVYGAQELVSAGVMVTPILAQDGVTELTAYPTRGVSVPEDAVVAVAYELPDTQELSENLHDSIAEVSERVDELE